MKEKLYLAGPEVFLPNAVEYAKRQRHLCERYGFVPLHPLDNNLDSEDSLETAFAIYEGDIEQIRRCDIIVANCNAFRGVCMDDGTAYELGFAIALGKKAYGYIDELLPLSQRIERDYPCRQLEDDRVADFEGYIITKDLGTSINLMMQCGIMQSGGRLIEGNFEDCLQIIHTDLNPEFHITFC